MDDADGSNSNDLTGLPLPRRENDRLLAGRGRFVDDLDLPHQVHAAFVRSTRAHATITDVETAAAKALPSVVTVLNGADLEALGILPLGAGSTAAATAADAPIRPPRWPLARHRVRHVGEAVALVVAETAAAAREAAEAVEITYKELACVVDAETALADGAPQLHTDAPGNLPCTGKPAMRRRSSAPSPTPPTSSPCSCATTGSP